jgi:hypothetical protein
MDVLGLTMYTPSEVFRTAFSYIENPSATSKTLPHGINQVCITCKEANNVDRIRDAASLKPWSDFYKTKEYAAYKCLSCGYQWSWYK